MQSADLNLLINIKVLLKKVMLTFPAACIIVCNVLRNKRKYPNNTIQVKLFINTFRVILLSKVPFKLSEMQNYSITFQ